jgi:hypothetical protein
MSKSVGPSLLTAALAFAGCAPSINPKMQSATDSLLASMKGGGHSEGVPASYEPAGWEVGHWLVYKVTTKDKPPSIDRISLVAKDADGFWLETEHQDYYHRVVSKALYSRMPKSAEEAVDVMQKIITKQDDDAVQVMDFSPAAGPAAALTKGLMKSYAAGITAPTQVASAPKEDITVAAGTFKGAAKFKGTISMGPFSREIIGWYHPAVPMNGAVKSESTDGDFVHELLDYGTSGAKSAL